MGDEWQKLDAEKSARILSEVNAFLEPVPFNMDTTIVRRMPLSFYKGYDFVELTDHSGAPPARKYAVYKPGDVNVVDWTNRVIFDLNDKAPVQVTEKSVFDYVKFFFTYIRGRNGRFQIIETADDIRWQVEPPLEGRKLMQELLFPLSLTGKDGEGIFHLEGFMLFRDTLFKTAIHVRPDGVVSMSDEDPKFTDLPVQHDAA
jgi:hypothetical protein